MNQPGTTGVVDGDVKHRIDPFQLAERTGPHDLQRSLEHRMVSIAESVHQHPVLLSCYRGHLYGFAGVGSHGLLAEHRFTGSERFDCPLVAPGSSMQG